MTVHTSTYQYVLVKKVFKKYVRVRLSTCFSWEMTVYHGAWPYMLYMYKYIPVCTMYWYENKLPWRRARCCLRSAGLGTAPATQRLYLTSMLATKYAPYAPHSVSPDPATARCSSHVSMHWLQGHGATSAWSHIKWLQWFNDANHKMMPQLATGGSNPKGSWPIYAFRWPLNYHDHWTHEEGANLSKNAIILNSKNFSHIKISITSN
jgi:hypothetical protein